MFRSCSKKAARLDRTSSGAADIANRAAEVAQQAAERATVLAQSAIELARPAVVSATPAVRRSASVASGKLSTAAERASAILADTAGWLSETSDTQRALSKKSGKKHRKLKLLVILTALAGGAVACLKSPFGCKLCDKLTGGPYPDDDEIEPEGITLSVEHQDDTPAGAQESTETNGVVASKTKKNPTDN